MLGINGSHLESIKELDLYALSGDKENERKYGKKAELIMAQIAEHEKERREREEKEEEEC